MFKGPYCQKISICQSIILFWKIVFYASKVVHYFVNKYNYFDNSTTLFKNKCAFDNGYDLVNLYSWCITHTIIYCCFIIISFDGYAWKIEPPVSGPFIRSLRRSLEVPKPKEASYFTKTNSGVYLVEPACLKSFQLI